MMASRSTVSTPVAVAGAAAWLASGESRAPWGMDLGSGAMFMPHLKRFPAKWRPVRVKKTRQIKNLEPRSDSIGTEKALVARPSRQIPDIVDPRRGGAAPDLPRRLELIALADAAPADAPVVRPAVAAGEQRGTTALAKMLEAR